MVTLDSTRGNANQDNILGIMKQDPKIYIILGLFLYICFLQNCSDQQEPTDEVTTEVSTDTTRITVVDTIQFIDTIVRTVVVNIGDPIIINDSIKEYTNNFNDSLLTGSVWTQVHGNLLDQTIDYVPKFPQYIIQIDTVIINNNQTTTIRKSNFSLNAGVEVGGNEEKFNFSPIVGFTTPRNNSYFYRYGLLDKTHSIGMTYNFKIKK